VINEGFQSDCWTRIGSKLTSDRQPWETAMKKNEVKKLKKLRLSRETLRELKSGDTQKVVAGVVMSGGSYQSGSCPCCVEV